MDKNLGDDTHTTGIGTAGTSCVATEYGDGKNHVTRIVVTAAALTVGDNANLAVGLLIYTFPTGLYAIKAAGGTVAITMEDAITTDTPEVGLGTIKGTGADATLGASVTTFEDIAGPIVATNTNGSSTLIDSNVSLPKTLIVLAAGSHALNLNFADAWANVTDTDSAVTATIWIEWSLLA